MPGSLWDHQCPQLPLLRGSTRCSDPKRVWEVRVMTREHILLVNYWGLHAWWVFCLPSWQTQHRRPQTQQGDPRTDGFPPGCPGYPTSTTGLYKGLTPVLGHDSKCPPPCTNPRNSTKPSVQWTWYLATFGTASIRVSHKTTSVCKSKVINEHEGSTELLVDRYAHHNWTIFPFDCYLSLGDPGSHSHGK